MNQTNESLVRERDFYRSKLESLEKQVKTLGTDCAYLQKQNDPVFALKSALLETVGEA